MKLTHTSGSSYAPESTETILTLLFFLSVHLLFGGDVVQSGLGDPLHPLVSHFVTLCSQGNLLVLRGVHYKERRGACADKTNESHDFKACMTFYCVHDTVTE